MALGSSGAFGLRTEDEHYALAGPARYAWGCVWAGVGCQYSGAMSDVLQTCQVQYWYCSISTVVPHIWREEGEALRRAWKWGHNSDINVISVIGIGGIRKYLGCAVGYTVFLGCYVIFSDPGIQNPDLESRSRIFDAFWILG